MVSVKDAYTKAADLLKKNGIEFYSADARILLESVLNIESGKLPIYYQNVLEYDEEKRYGDFIEKRIKKVPVSYITNKKEFYSLDFYVESGVLIPRCDTEILADEALKAAKEPSDAADLCCGSGCIGLTLAKYRPYVHTELFDISPAAVRVSKINKERLKIENASVSELDIMKFELPHKYDMILSNPPYIPRNDFDSLQEDVKNYEPALALTDGGDGLSFYKRLKYLSDKYLKKHGILVAEIGINQLEDVKKIFGDIDYVCDLSGIPRVIKYKV